MSGVIFILGMVAVYLTTPETLRGVLLASKEVRTEVLEHAEVVMLRSASEAAIATVFDCRPLATLDLHYCIGLTNIIAVFEEPGVDFSEVNIAPVYQHATTTSGGQQPWIIPTTFCQSVSRGPLLTKLCHAGPTKTSNRRAILCLLRIDRCPPGLPHRPHHGAPR